MKLNTYGLPHHSRGTPLYARDSSGNDWQVSGLLQEYWLGDLHIIHSAKALLLLY